MTDPYSQTRKEAHSLTKRIFDRTPLTVGVIQIEAVLRAIREEGMVFCNRDDLEAALDATGYIRDTYFWHKHKYEEPVQRLWEVIYTTTPVAGWARLGDPNE